MKKGILEVLQVLAFSAFIGIAAYGALIYWGGEAREKIPVSSSLLLGSGAVICIIAIMIIGSALDKMATEDDADRQPEADGND